jgi:hypothetical protein
VSTACNGLDLLLCGPLNAASVIAQLAFKRWTEQRYWEVVAIYEDRHEVAVVGAGGRLMRKSIPFKRTKVLHTRYETHRESVNSPQNGSWLLVTILKLMQ